MEDLLVSLFAPVPVVSLLPGGVQCLNFFDLERPVNLIELYVPDLLGLFNWPPSEEILITEPSREFNSGLQKGTKTSIKNPQTNLRVLQGKRQDRSPVVR